ncbi:MAG: hypothetical protein GXX84_04065 [Acidobacteria bacterium]|nr:hypothetical protein [Acidobacteriota bacterium]
MGTVLKGGFVDFDPSTWWGNKRAARTYNEAVAKLVGGNVIERKDDQYVVRIGTSKMPRLSALLPHHEQEWLDAIERYIQECLAESVNTAATMGS